MLKDYAHTLILAVIAALLVVIVVQLGSVLEAVRATDDDAAAMRDHLSLIRGYVCVRATSDADECWAHQEPGAQ